MIWRGTGTLEIASGAIVTNDSGYIGRFTTGTGTVEVDGTGSAWINSGDLNVGTGSGVLNIRNDGQVTVGGTTVLNDGGAINLDGGRLEFGTMSLHDFSEINGTSGSIAGACTPGLHRHRHVKRF